MVDMSTIASLIVLTGINLAIMIIEISRYIHDLHVYAGRPKEQEKAYKNRRHQLWTALLIYVVLVVITLWKSGVPLF